MSRINVLLDVADRIHAGQTDQGDADQLRAVFDLVCDLLDASEPFLDPRGDRYGYFAASVAMDDDKRDRFRRSIQSFEGGEGPRTPLGRSSSHAALLDAARDALPWLAGANDRGYFRECAAPLAGLAAWNRLRVLVEEQS